MMADEEVGGCLRSPCAGSEGRPVRQVFLWTPLEFVRAQLDPALAQEQARLDRLTDIVSAHLECYSTYPLRRGREILAALTWVRSLVVALPPYDLQAVALVTLALRARAEALTGQPRDAPTRSLAWLYERWIDKILTYLTPVPAAPVRDLRTGRVSPVPAERAARVRLLRAQGRLVYWAGLKDELRSNLASNATA